jgi:hypothetical protein
MITGEDRDLFERGLAHATSAHAGAGSGAASGEALDAALDDLGWTDALGVDRQTAVSLLFEHQGRACAVSSALDQVMLTSLDLDPSVTAAVVLPPLGRSDPPGEVVGEGLVVRGFGTGGLARSETALVVSAGGADGPVAVVVDTVDLAPRPVSGLDPTLGLIEVAADGMRAPARSPASAPSPASWNEAVAAGRLALAHELVGASRAMLDLARTHAVERIQFGRPIGSFQAVRHRLAEALVAIEAADAAVGAGWDAGTPVAAAMAKALAGRSARTVARHAQQVLAGIGFTTEHPLHRYVRRTLVLDRLLGDARTLTDQVGTEVLRTRHLPPMLPL